MATKPDAPKTEKTKRVTAIVIELTSGGHVEWTREADDMDTVFMAEGNVLVINDSHGDALALYNAHSWVNVVSTYDLV